MSNGSISSCYDNDKIFCFCFSSSTLVNADSPNLEMGASFLVAKNSVAVTPSVTKGIARVLDTNRYDCSCDVICSINTLCKGHLSFLWTCMHTHHANTFLLIQ